MVVGVLFWVCVEGHGGSWQEHLTVVACLMHLKSKEQCRKPLGSQKALQGYTSSDLLPPTIS